MKFISRFSFLSLLHFSFLFLFLSLLFVMAAALYGFQFLILVRGCNNMYLSIWTIYFPHIYLFFYIFYFGSPTPSKKKTQEIEFNCPKVTEIGVSPARPIKKQRGGPCSPKPQNLLKLQKKNKNKYVRGFKINNLLASQPGDFLPNWCP